MLHTVWKHQANKLFWRLHWLSSTCNWWWWWWCVCGGEGCLGYTKLKPEQNALKVQGAMKLIMLMMDSLKVEVYECDRFYFLYTFCFALRQMDINLPLRDPK